MRALVLTTVLLALPASAGRKNKADPGGDATSMADPAAQVLGRALQSRDITWLRMQELCDDIGHRLTGSAELEAAVDWAAAHMERDGLRVSKEPVTARKWVRGQESLMLLGDHPRALPMLGLGNAIGTDGKPLEAEVLVVGSFEELEARKSDAKGKIVLYDVPFTSYGETVKFRVGGPSEAAKHGAVAALVRSVGPHSLATPHTGTLYYAPDVPQIPAAAVDIETATQLRRRQERGHPATVRLTMEARFEGDITTHNVVGELRGREKPDEIVVVGCHLDSWDVGQGAQDDAAGCVAAMEAGRLLAGLDRAPKRTVRVVLFTNEENGVAGGKGYAKAHADENIVAAMEMDTGAGAFLGYRIDARVSDDQDASDAERARIIDEFQAVAPLFAGLGPEFIPSFAGTDVSPLIKRGALGVGIHMDTTGYWPIHHTAADTLDKIDRKAFQDDVAGMALMTFVLAEWDGLPTVQTGDSQ